MGIGLICALTQKRYLNASDFVNKTTFSFRKYEGANKFQVKKNEQAIAIKQAITKHIF